MLELLEIELTNFRSWEYLHLTDLNSKGLTLISGMNGSGKSSVRQAIEYILIDSTSDNIPVSDLPRNQDTECTLTGVIKRDNDIIKIIKYRNHKKHGNSIILDINGEYGVAGKEPHPDKEELERLHNHNH